MTAGDPHNGSHCTPGPVAEFSRPFAFRPRPAQTGLSKAQTNERANVCGYASRALQALTNEDNKKAAMAEAQLTTGERRGPWGDVFGPFRSKRKEENTSETNFPPASRLLAPSPWGPGASSQETAASPKGISLKPSSPSSIRYL
ncbi:hypothetical protein AAFF_G00171890 [Aldrovandia affinis]|uniref:Uncharacterized protein n=1 Tax=Aldrovandia affinis TaxID=143900 RepID=A0AAD7SZF6_9TELE|nr:hypothetical protein AAFF_G00171890 [Aldrovandia affinis]